MQNAPLSGINILDFTALLPAAMCTMYLADMGASVIKVEPPEHGDGARGPKGSSPTNFFLITNRNKRSVELDLKQAKGRDAALKLAAEAHVIVEGFRPGVMDRLGVGYEAVKAVNPSAVYCSITGYGQTGPLASKGGHDINYQAYAGVLAQNVIDGSRPSPGDVPIADLAGGGVTAALGIVAALFSVQRGGPGRYIDVSMTDCAMALNIPALASKLTNGGIAPIPGRNTLSGGLPCYRTYPTSDGRYLAFGALEPKFWLAFCAAVNRPDLQARGWDSGQDFDSAVSEIAALVAVKSFAEWCELLTPLDACVTPVLMLDEVLEHPHTAARGMVKQVEGCGVVTLQYAFPLRMSDFEFEVRYGAPRLGEHNQELAFPSSPS